MMPSSRPVGGSPRIQVVALDSDVFPSEFKAPKNQWSFSRLEISRMTPRTMQTNPVFSFFLAWI
jgi:hypothetical protein